MPVYEGIAQFCYTKDLPADAVAIAQISSSITTPSDLVDVSNTGPFADLTIRLIGTSDGSPADFTCPDYFQPVIISGSSQYKVNNQFFQLTNIVDVNSNPLWYMHQLPTSISGAAIILDLSGNIIISNYKISSNMIYHSLIDQPYLVEYTDQNGYVHTNLLQTTPIISRNFIGASPNAYTLAGRFLEVDGTGSYHIQFTQQDGYMVLPPWTNQPNSPWYARVRFPLNPFPSEYATQAFTPQIPYMLGSYIPGKVYAKNIIKFERPNIYVGTSQLPNILVLDANLKVKYAIDGSRPGTKSNLGTQFNWQQGLIYDIDAYSASVQLSVDIDLTDVVYGFYIYDEPDIPFRAIDVNPITNPVVKNRYIHFYTKTSNPNPLINVYYQVVDPVTGNVSGATNDTGGGTPVQFATLSVGADVSPSSFTITDIRQRGGGLASNFQDDPSASSCWDIGFLDGQPYPVSGSILVYLPVAILGGMDRSLIQASIQAVLPAGVYPLIRFYDQNGVESI